MDIFITETGRIMLASIPYVLLGFTIAFFVLGGILDYHWRTYGIGFLRLPIFRIVYSGVGLLLLFIMTSVYLSL
jgi:hypothetical protein